MKQIERSAQPYAVIYGLDNITGLQTARVLAARGVPVLGIVRDPHHACARTRVCRYKLVADTWSEEGIRTLETLGPLLGSKAVLIPCSDMAVLLLSRHRERLASWFHFALPAPDVVEMLVDKVRFYTFAESAGLPVPRAFFLHNRADAERAARELVFPAVMKPPVRTPLWEKGIKEKGFKVESGADLLAQYTRCAGYAEMLMVQEWVEGDATHLYSCNAYFDADAQPLVTFIAQKLRQWPQEVGIASLSVEAREDKVRDTAVRLFQSVHFHGLGYIEMKRDARTGRAYIIEPNIGRPTGRSTLAEAAGVEMTMTLYCDLLGLPLPAERVQQYRGVKWIYLRHDLQAALQQWRSGTLTPAAWLRSLRGPKTDSLLSWRDPIPFLADTGRGVGKMVARVRRVLTRQRTRGALASEGHG